MNMHMPWQPHPLQYYEWMDGMAGHSGTTAPPVHMPFANALHTIVDVSDLGKACHLQDHRKVTTGGSQRRHFASKILQASNSVSKIKRSPPRSQTILIFIPSVRHTMCAVGSSSSSSPSTSMNEKKIETEMRA